MNNKTELKRIGRKGLVTLIVASSVLYGGCWKKNIVEPPISQQIQQVFKKDSKNVLTIYLSPDGLSQGYVKKFYDLDGDGRTVEQYIEYIGTPDGRFPPVIKRNICKKGIKPLFTLDGNFTETMSHQEEENLNKEYISILERCK
ncbi:MAG: hypothetical protein AABW80_04785 [Nanoarchaeota archaeon]